MLATMRKLCLLTLMAWLLVACGSSTGGNQAAATDAPAGSDAAVQSAPPPSEDAAPVIRIGFSAWPGWIPWQVAVEKDLFAQNGVNVEMVWFEGYLDSINAFASGRLDGNSQTLNDTLSSVAAGADQVIVLVNDNSTGNDQIIVSAEINNVADLAGKTVAAELGTVDHFLLLLGLRDAGISQTDINFQPLETGAAAAAFVAGQLDAVGVFAPFTTRALQREGSKVLFSSADYPGAIPDHLVLSRALVNERPDDVQKIIQTWYDTLAYIEANPDEAYAIMAERAGVSVEDYRTYDEGTTIFSVQDNLNAFSPGDSMAHLPYAAQQIADFLVENELAASAPDVSQLFDDRFVQTYANSMENQ
ncbi:MAG: aliphatic sulfonate ABC transporter substrate-binding protein [Chloroflexales bacterium]|nr:aliphatic sulfonate ABC transporter substrate-binding protein [Chloroflexales bacterium]